MKSHPWKVTPAREGLEVWTVPHALETSQQIVGVAKQFVDVAAATNEPTVVETRPELIVALRAMLQFIGLQQIAAPSDDLTALINELNALIVSSLSTVRASDTRAENSKKKDAGKTDTAV